MRRNAIAVAVTRRIVAYPPATLSHFSRNRHMSGARQQTLVLIYIYICVDSTFKEQVAMPREGTRSQTGHSKPRVFPVVDTSPAVKRATKPKMTKAATPKTAAAGSKPTGVTKKKAPKKESDVAKKVCPEPSRFASSLAASRSPLTRSPRSRLRSRRPPPRQKRRRRKSRRRRRRRLIRSKR